MFSDIDLKGGYHEFWAEKGNSHYGREWDIGTFKTFHLDDAEMVLGVQYADYDADNFKTDTRKLWVSLDFILGPTPFREMLGPAATD